MAGDQGAPAGGPFDRFTERARWVLTLAQEEAQRFNHNYMGTEHLLLGLAREGEGVAAKVLANLGVELDKVREQVEFIIGRGERAVVGEIGLTPRAKKVLQLAKVEARKLGHHYIGPEHILLGLISEGEGIAAGVLESLGVGLEQVRAEVIGVLTQAGTAPISSVERHRRSQAVDTHGSAWEYLIARASWAEGEPRVVWVHGNPGVSVEGRMLLDALHLLGTQGWELVGVEPVPASQGPLGTTQYLLKRNVALEQQ